MTEEEAKDLVYKAKHIISLISPGEREYPIGNMTIRVVFAGILLVTPDRNFWLWYKTWRTGYMKAIQKLSRSNIQYTTALLALKMIVDGDRDTTTEKIEQCQQELTHLFTKESFYTNLSHHVLYSKHTRLEKVTFDKFKKITPL